ncbi:helix-turn-helix domain-containing protein [Sulfuracidifex tepidarius]|nr:helix-turn-helix domain-containing protein [Sulfuracidifex tepidarius]
MKGDFIILDVKSNDRICRILLEVRSDQAVVEKVCNTFSKVGKETFLCTMTTDSPIAKIVSSYSILTGSMLADSVVWTFILEGYSELKHVLKDLLSVTKGVKVIKVKKILNNEPLTAKQEQILRIALDSGFYDFPRKVTERELAKRLNISQSSLSEVLRRAEKNVIIDYFRKRGL